MIVSTIIEIAKKCNVSPTTVSNTINNRPNVSENTRKKVLEAIKELNYTPNYIAKNLKMKSTRSIGIIVEDITIFSVPSVIDGITKHCTEKNYQTLLFNLRLFQRYEKMYYHSQEYYEQVRREINEFVARQVEGIIYVSGHERKLTFIPQNIPVPVVIAYAFSDNPNNPSVVIDDADGAFQAVSHIIANGHKKIGVISGLNDSPHTQERLKGYQQALFENKLLYNPHLVIESNWNIDGGYECTDRLLDQGVTAIFCMNDLMAGGVYKRLAELDLAVGKDISVIGFDDRESTTYYEPPLTTVKLPLQTIGYQASEILHQTFQKGSHSTKNDIYSIKCELSLGKSVQEIS